MSRRFRNLLIAAAALIVVGTVGWLALVFATVPHAPTSYAVQIRAYQPGEAPPSRFIANLTAPDFAELPRPLQQAIGNALGSGTSNATLSAAEYQQWSRVSDKIAAREGTFDYLAYEGKWLTFLSQSP